MVQPGDLFWHLLFSKLFDEYHVNFCSVTQEFNTSTSTGRMMLNILMTFAEFERSIVTERIRDKIAATRRKGDWVGGTVPCGYKVENKNSFLYRSGQKWSKGCSNDLWKSNLRNR